MSDELDKILYQKLNSAKKVPKEKSDKLKVIIHESLYNKTDKKVHKYSLIKVVMTSCASLLLTAGIVYAGTTVVEKIWKQPQKTVGFYSEENKDKNTITKEEQASIMTEIEAKEKAKKLLEKFGHEREKIELVELENNAYDYEILWHIKTEKGTNIRFNAKDETYFSISFEEVSNDNITQYRTNKVEAEETARQICEKYGYNLEEYNDVNVKSNLNSEKDSYIWYVDFSKKYEGLKNPYEEISIGFIPEINKLYYLKVNDKKYENNSLQITEEQAKKIVLGIEEKIDTVYSIKNINTMLGIAKMNGDAYLRMTDYEQYRKQKYNSYPSEKIEEYRTESRVRKVWMVFIEYDILDSVDYDTESYNPFDNRYTYYIDGTTGEVIGGAPIYYEWIEN